MKLANKYLKNRKVVLHTDKAKAYKIRVEGVLHDSVRHCKKRVKKGNRYVWSKPVYTKLTSHRLPDGTKLRTKAGTQIIDRAWRFIRSHMHGFSGKPGAQKTEAAIRSAQWLYWHRNQDLWKMTGDMLGALRA